ncbi:MAG: hypothetical protein SGILL_002225 [Bacillariaceae sp.]
MTDTVKTLEEQAASAEAAVKLQSFLRGCVCRAKVSDMLGDMIKDMLEAEAAASAKAMPEHSSDATLQTIETAPINDGNENNDEEEEEIEVIDGLRFPKSIPSNILDQSMSSRTSFSMDDSIHSKPSSVRSRIGVFQKGNSSSSIFSGSQSSFRKEKAKGVPVPTSKRGALGSLEKRDSVTSLGSAGSLKDQLGFSASDFDKCEPSVYDVPFLKNVSGHSSTGRRNSASEKQPSSNNLGSKIKAFESKSVENFELNSSFHSLSDDALPSRRDMLQRSSHSVSSLGRKKKNKTMLKDKVAVFEGYDNTNQKKGAPLFVANQKKKSKSLPRGRQMESSPPSWRKTTSKSNAVDADASVAETVAETVDSSAASTTTTTTDGSSRPKTIKERIHQLRAANRELPSDKEVVTASTSADVEVKRLDYTTKLYMMENSATKIQALSRGYFLRKREKEAQEAADTVVKWLKEFKLLEEDASVSTLEMPEELREMAVQALAAEIDRDGVTEDSSEVEASEEPSEVFEEETFQIMGSPTVAQRKKAFEQPVEEENVATETQLRFKPIEEQQPVVKVLSSLNKKQTEAATKIQALVRGFVERKFDVKTMLTVVNWISEQQDEQKKYDHDDFDEFEPVTEDLETAWSFLESNNTWTRDHSKMADEEAKRRGGLHDDSVDVEDEEALPEKIDIAELVNTWEYLLVSEKNDNDPPISSDGETIPTEEDIANMQGWMEDHHALVDAGGELGFLGKGRKKSKNGSTNVRIIRTTHGVRAVKIGETGRGQNSVLASSPVDSVSNSIAPRGKVSSLSEKFRTNHSLTTQASSAPVMLASEGSHDVSSNSGTSGVKKDDETSHQEPTTMKELVSMWKWLASHGMDMQSFQRRNRSQDDPSSGNEKSGIRDPNYRSSTTESFGTHRMHDEPSGSGGGIQYIDGEDPSKSPSAIDVGKDSEYNRHRMHDEFHSGEGDGVIYLDEDLSSPQTKPNRTTRSATADKPCRHYSYNAHKMHDELSGSKGDAIEYIDEDLSASYLDLATSGRSPLRKPSMKAMMNYWQFSSHHSKATSVGEPQGIETVAEPSDTAATDENSDVAKEQDSIPASKDWRTCAANNDFLGTLAWLKSKGIELNEVKPDSSSQEEAFETDEIEDRSSMAETESSVEASKRDSLKDSLDWLQSKGYGRKGHGHMHSTTGDTDDSKSQAVASDTESVDNSSDSKDGDDDDSTLSEEVAEALLPKKSDMTDTLKWLQSRGYRMPKKETAARTDEGGSSAVEPDAESVSVPSSAPSSSGVAGALNWLEDHEQEAKDDDDISVASEADDQPVTTKGTGEFKDVLHSLSWLKKHGFNLDKSESGESAAGDDDSVADDTPTRKEVVDALETLHVEENASLRKPDNEEDRYDSSSSAIEANPDVHKAKAKPNTDMEQTLAWLTKRGMKLPKKSSLKSKAKVSQPKSSQKHEVVSVFSKKAQKTLRFDESPSEYVYDPVTEDESENSTETPQKQRKKTKGRVSIVPNKPKKTSTPMDFDGMSALQWLQFKKGITVENKPKAPKGRVSKGILEGTEPGSPKKARITKDKNGTKARRRSASPVEISADEAKETLDNVFKLSTHVRSSKRDGGKKSAPSTGEMEQALSWLKMRESRRHAQAAASTFTPPAPSLEATNNAHEKAQVRVLKSKPSASTSEPLESSISDLSKAAVKSISNNALKLSSGRAKKKSKSTGSSAKSEKAKSKTKNSVSDKKKKAKTDKSTNEKPSKSDMTKALMFLQQRRNMPAKVSTDSHPVIETEKNSQVPPQKKKPIVKSGKGAEKENSPKELRNIKSQPSTPNEEKPKMQEERDYQNALKYLLGSSPDALEDEPYFAKLDSMLPLKSSQSTEARAKEMSKALKWIKKQGVTISGTKPSSEKSLEKTSSHSEKKRKGDAEQTSDDYQNCMKWLTSTNRDSIPDAKQFKKLDSMLPKKPDQSTADRAREMCKALSWVKKSSAKKDATRLPETNAREKPNSRKTSKSPGRRTSKSPARSSGSRSPRSKGKPKLTVRKEKGKASGSEAPPVGANDADTKNALQWLKKVNRDELDDAANFKKLDSMLPKKAGQTPEQRAIEMSKALKLLRKRDKPAAAQAKVPPSSLSAEEKQLFLYLMAKLTGKDASSMANAELYKRVDNMMPSKTGQAPEDRAKEMTKMMAWLKKKGKL